MTLTRRDLLGMSAATAALAAAPDRLFATTPTAGRQIRATEAMANLVGPDYPATSVWAYDASLPGPELRFRQGKRLQVTLRNDLPEPTTIHWHGIRTPADMDGAPWLSQRPVEPGGHFDYAFTLPDAGTNWYHPHTNTMEQVGRGLAGPLIVEEAAPPPADRDLVWMLDDWRLTREAAVDGDFRAMHDLTHAGRLGNTVTINGRLPDRFTLQRGERVRLRLVNAANARTFGLTFGGHRTWLIAMDGQPLGQPQPMAPDTQVVLVPGARADLLLDGTGEPDRSYPVRDDYYGRGGYRLIDLAYDDGPPLRPVAELGPPAPLPANPVGEPDLGAAETVEMRLQGGAMGRMRSGRVAGQAGELDLRDMVRQHGMVWAIDGVARPPMTEHGPHEPLLSVPLGATRILRIANDTAFEHPMHLHGHSFRVLSLNGRRLERPMLRDMVMIAPDTTGEIAFLADNPGDWMFHCHILEHQYSGMMGFVRVG